MIHVKRLIVGLLLLLVCFVGLVLGFSGIVLLWHYLVDLTSPQVQNIGGWALLGVVGSLMAVGILLLAYETGQEFLESRRK